MSEVMTAKELAEYLDVHLDTIYRMARKKEIPHFRIRRKVYFKKTSIDSWIREQEQKNYINEPPSLNTLYLQQ